MALACQGCKDGEELNVSFSMAFQPIIDIRSDKVFAHEALVRGPNGEGSNTVLQEIDVRNRYVFDQKCRAEAIRLASGLFSPGGQEMLSINFMPNAVYEPRACIRATLAAALECGFPLSRIIFEFTENEALDTEHILKILSTYREMGFKTAIDDFGAGHAGLGLLALFQPDIVKIDMGLIRGIEKDLVKQKIVRHTVAMLADLGVTALCEGVETAAELSSLQDLGVHLIQGYVFAKPTFQSLAIPRSAQQVLSNRV